MHRDTRVSAEEFSWISCPSAPLTQVRQVRRRWHPAMGSSTVPETLVGADVDVGVPGDFGAGNEPAVPIEAAGFPVHAGGRLLEGARGRLEAPVPAPKQYRSMATTV